MNTWLCVIGVKQILANGARPLFQIVLLLIFLYFFGWPIIETYTKKEVMVVEKKLNSQGIPIPDHPLLCIVSFIVSRPYWTCSNVRSNPLFVWPGLAGELQGGRDGDNVGPGGQHQVGQHHAVREEGGGEGGPGTDRPHPACQQALYVGRLGRVWQ